MSRQLYEMMQEDLDKILDAGKPVRYMIIGGHLPSSRQENANAAWQRLADKMGFVWDTAKPAHHGGMRFFTAEPKPSDASITHTEAAIGEHKS